MEETEDSKIQSEEKTVDLDSGNSASADSAMMEGFSKTNNTDHAVCNGNALERVESCKESPELIDLAPISEKDKVAQIFQNAGKAFTGLGELTMWLQNNTVESNRAKEELDSLHASISTLQQDIEKLQRKRKQRSSDIVRNFQSQQLTWVDYSPKFMRQILGDSTTTAPFTAAATTVAKPPATTAAKPPLVYAKKSKPA